MKQNQLITFQENLTIMHFCIVVFNIQWKSTRIH